MPSLAPAQWAELLSYLEEVGYGEVYLPQRTGAVEERPAAAEQRAGKPPVTRRRAEAPVAPPRPAERPVRSPRRQAQQPAEPPTSSKPEEPLADSLSQLAQQSASCTACRLADKRHSVVFGSGAESADLMFIGEGPGAEEDRQGLPFVGAAGQLLTRIIGAIGLEREQVYIANAVKCRPPGNRNPRGDEIAACNGFLRRQIELVQPRVIVLLGKVAAQALLGLDEGVPLYRMRDRWHTVFDTPTRVTYHPAALLRNASYKRPTWEDMQVVRDRLSEAD